MPNAFVTESTKLANNNQLKQNTSNTQQSYSFTFLI